MPLSAVILIVVSVLLVGDAISYASNGDLFSAGEHMVRAVFTLSATIALADQLARWKEKALVRPHSEPETAPGAEQSVARKNY